MKMVKVNGKMVPFFAADGKGSKDLKKALAGAMVKKYAMGGEVEEKPYKYMRSGGKMAYAENGNDVPNGDPKKEKSPYFRTEDVASVAYTSNEGMRSAQSEGKIDAYNFDVPAGGLDAMPPEEQERLRNTPFGKKYLKGSGSLDAQYQRYSAKVNRFINENPDKALAAADEMIASGNSNFARALEGKSDEEKLRLMRSYMTDKKIGDFHGAIEFDRMAVPTVAYHTPKETHSRSRVGEGPVKRKGFMVAVGNRAVKSEDAVRMLEQAEAEGIDLTGTADGTPNPDAIDFLERFMDENGSQERGPRMIDGESSQEGMYQGAVDYYFMKKDERAAKEQLSERERQMRERQKNRPRYDSRGRLIQEEMNLGGMIYKRADKGTKVKYTLVEDKDELTEEQRERGVTSVSRGLFNRTEHFGNRGKVKYPTRLGRVFTKRQFKASF